MPEEKTQGPMEECSCLLCGSSSYHPILHGRDNLHGLPGRFRVVECTECGFRYTNPRPGIQHIQQYYPPEYGPHTRSRIPESAAKPSVLRRLVRGFLGTYLNSQGTWTPPATPGLRVLDLGCANGAFLASLKDRPWDLYGVERSPSAARYATGIHGLNVFTGTLEEAAFADGHFDIVFSWMVIEHLHDPVSTLQEIHRVLKPGGLFIGSVPNAGAWEWQFFRSYWNGLDVPRHLSHFTEATLTDLLAETGFAVERIIHQRTLSNVVVSAGLCMKSIGLSESLAGFLCDYPRSGSLGTILLKCILHPTAIALSFLRQAGRLTVVARRTG